MNYRPLGKTGWRVSDIGFGAWAFGGNWGHVSEADALAALNKVVDSGVTFIDTADVHGDGRSERLVASLKKDRKQEIVVATKAGRRLPRQTVEGYTRSNLTKWLEDSLRNLSTDAIDLLQLHCPPTELYRPEVFVVLDDLMKAGKIRRYGINVEKLKKHSELSNSQMYRPCKSSSIASGRGPLSCSSLVPRRNTSAFSLAYPWPAVC